MAHELQSSKWEVALGRLRRIERGVFGQRDPQDAAVFVAVDWKDWLAASSDLDS